MQTHPRRVLNASVAFVGFYLGSLCFLVVSALASLRTTIDAREDVHAAFGMVVSEGAVILFIAAGVQLAVVFLLARVYLDLPKIKVLAGQLCLGLLTAWVSSISVLPWGIFIIAAVSALVARGILAAFPSIARPSKKAT